MQTKKNKNSRKIRKQIATIAAIAYCTAGISGIMPEGSVYNMFEGTSVTVNAADPTVKISATTSDVALDVNKYYYSPDKNYYVVFQGDGNLVVYKKNGTAIWNSGTCGRGGNRCVLQNDGDLVIYSNAGKIWHTATSGKRNPELKLQNDGKLSVYSTAQNTTSWSSKNNSGYPLYPSTSQPVSNNTVNNNTSSGVPYTSTPADILSATTGNTNFEMSKFYYSPDRNYFIVFQNDGNLVIYRDKGRVPVWNSETNGRGGNRCVLQKDGNLVIYSNDGAIWKTGTMGKNSPALRMMNGGTLVMYSTETNTVSWSSANSQGYKLYPAPKTTTEQKSQRTIEDGVYIIRNKNSNLFLSTYDKSDAGTSVIQYFRQQSFNVKYESDGYYSICPLNGNGAIGYSDSNKANTNGEDAHVYNKSNASEQRFTIKAAEGGGYEIGTKASGGNKVLEVTNSTSENCEIVQIWEHSTDRMNDNWDFEPISNEYTPTGETCYTNYPGGWDEFLNKHVPNDTTARATLKITNESQRKFRMPYEFFVNRSDKSSCYIPNENNCTVICIQNLLNYYRYIDNIAIQMPENTKVNMYNQIVNMAKAKHSYNGLNGGLPLSQHKTTCEDAFNMYGYKDTNVNTFSFFDGGFSSADLCREEPYILSSSVKYHSIFVYGWHKANISFTINGSLYEDEIILLEAWDPNGKVMFVDGNNVVSNAIDLEQVMYISSSKRR